MSYKASPGYVTRTLIGLDKPEGGFAQPITLQRARQGGWNIELLVGVQPDTWELITKIEIHKQDPVIIHTEQGAYGTKYTNAIRARVRK